MKGQYVAPGFIDSHVHIESSMVTIPVYANAVMLLDTTSVIINPHEITNVLGLKGLQFMPDSTALTPLGVYFMLSSRVPVTHTMGGVLDDPFIQLSFLTLPVFLELKISGRGLFDVMKFDHVLLFVEEIFAVYVNIFIN